MGCGASKVNPLKHTTTCEREWPETKDPSSIVQLPLSNSSELGSQPKDEQDLDAPFTTATKADGSAADVKETVNVNDPSRLISSESASKPPRNGACNVAEEKSEIPPGHPEESQCSADDARSSSEHERRCAECGLQDSGNTLTLDSDQCLYCVSCWTNFYGRPPDPPREPLVKLRVRGTLTPQELHQEWQRFHLEQEALDQPETTNEWVQGEADPLTARQFEDGDDDEDARVAELSVRVLCDPRVIGSAARQAVFQAHASPREGDLVANRYRIQAKIGQGNFSTSYRARDERDQTECCLKFEDKTSLQVALDKILLHERLQRVDPEHVFFPHLRETLYAHERFISVEECLSGQNLWQIVERDPTHFQDLRRLRELAEAMLNALVVLERAAIIHCDIKPDNIMCTSEVLREMGGPEASGRYKLLDFGCSRADKVDPMFALKEDGAGHIGHSSIEMLLRKPVNSKNDIWALGITLAELFTARLIWAQGDTEAEILAKMIGLCGMERGLPFDAYRLAGFNYQMRMHPSGFPLRTKLNYQGSQHSTNEVAVLEILEPDAPSGASWGLCTFLATEEPEFVDFLTRLLDVDPAMRPCASEALRHNFIARSKNIS